MAKKQKLPKGIYEKDGKFVASPTYNGRRKSKTCNTLEEAITAKQALLEQLMTGADLAQGDTKVSTTRDWTLQYALDVAKSTPPGQTRSTGGWLGLASREKQVFNAQAALNYFGPQTLLKDLDFTGLQNYVNHLAKLGNSGSTINRKLAALSKLFSLAELHGVLKKRPTMPRQQEGEARDRVVSREEEAVILNLAEQLKKDDFRDAIIVLLDTGVRVGELRKLQPRHVDVQNNQLALTADITKNRKAREVPLTPRAREVVVRHKLGAAPKDTLWACTYGHLRQTWDYIKGAIGLADDTTFVLHTCRHTCASRLVAAGVPLPGVQKYMGHANITTTMRYIKYAPSLLHGAAEALNKFNSRQETESPETQPLADDADLG